MADWMSPFAGDVCCSCVGREHAGVIFLSHPPDVKVLVQISCWLLLLWQLCTELTLSHLPMASSQKEQVWHRDLTQLHGVCLSPQSFYFPCDVEVDWVEWQLSMKYTVVSRNRHPEGGVLKFPSQKKRGQRQDGKPQTSQMLIQTGINVVLRFSVCMRDLVVTH